MRLTQKHYPHHLALPLLAAGLLFASTAQAGAQVHTPLSASVRAVLQRSVSDQAVSKPVFATQYEADVWLNEMSRRLQKRMPDTEYRTDFLKTVHYEAKRAGVDPQMVLGLIEVESGFKKYAVSSAGARGYMQVMPFWVKEIGTSDHNLFHLRTNLRYGCTILRHYLDMENGNLYRALGRYNGSLGRPEYPNLVRTAWHKYWDTTPKLNRSLSAKSDRKLSARHTPGSGIQHAG
ncbi:MAG: lytic transglycosylase domain-containing protein [Nitrosomonadales bacterium]|nr:lytic transglycosylase domain-containing protein [Nitrosomonadales bacterium]